MFVLDGLAGAKRFAAPVDPLNIIGQRCTHRVRVVGIPAVAESGNDLLHCSVFAAVCEVVHGGRARQTDRQRGRKKEDQNPQKSARVLCRSVCRSRFHVVRSSFHRRNLSYISNGICTGTRPCTPSPMALGVSPPKGTPILA